MNIQKLEKKWQNLENKKKTIKGNLSDLDFIGEFINKINNKQDELLASGKKDLSAWDRVYLSRHVERPKAKQWIEALFDDVFYLHGDRYFADDGTIIGALGYLDDIAVTIIGTNKGKTLEENLKCNFGMSSPEGYRKALRLMKQAEKFNRPVITIIDTPGAYPGIGAEERGQGEAIAKNLFYMSDLKVPIIAIITGEGGSGGALALSVADKIIMLENATFSILSPEGFASILWKNAKLAKKAAQKMRMTASDLYELDLIDHVIEEGICFKGEDFEELMKECKFEIRKYLDELMALSKDELVEKRYLKYREIGQKKENCYGI